MGSRDGHLTTERLRARYLALQHYFGTANWLAERRRLHPALG